uniref:Uncharacterized protein n=1 Tax=Tetraselmis chuii TaxID=63592 RepID=A0A7S1X9G4_9CHLO|mmetsp:Transcript_42364/g.76025  ORF Transcript_42364/g.76025 Transcript_42364/m.76025 type:complete len:251 (+) Transcript_42364:180-932(+)
MHLTTPHSVESDVLGKTVAFFAKRDGIDKALKLLQYTSKLVVAVAGDGSSKGAAVHKLSVFARNVSQSRKALRLGKFLADLKKIRRQAPLSTPLGLLEGLGNSASCVYYFMEQFVWLSKAGVITDKQWQSRISNASVYAEMLGYIASITLKCLQLSVVLEREVALSADLKRRRAKARHSGAESVDGSENALLLEEIHALRRRRDACFMEMVQDLMDSLIAWNDIRGGYRPTVLAVAGLVSAAISANKNWP